MLKKLDHYSVRCVRTAQGIVIDLYLAQSDRIQLSLFDIAGREVHRLADGRQYTRGMHREYLNLQHDLHLANGSFILVAKGLKSCWATKLILLR